MLTITPIGSCRIATPLRLCRESHGFRMNMNRVYGYSHTSAEAVQQMNFLQGSFTPNEDLWPLISPRWQERDRNDEVHHPSDLYVVEICSAKQASINGQCVQINYLNRQYQDFFSDKDRTRICYRLARDPDEAALGSWLDEVWNGSPEQHKDSAILRQLRVSNASVDDICGDMLRLQDGLGEVMFVTHVNACAANGEPLSGRAEFIERVTQAARRIGARLYNPTTLMETVGQHNAIEDHSTSLAHFTDSFSQKLLEDWYKFAIHDIIEQYIIENPEDTIRRIIMPHAEAFLKTRDPERIADIVILLDALESYFPENINIKLLRFRIALSEGNPGDLKRSFFQLVISGDALALQAIDDASDLPERREWVEELREAKRLPERSQRWLHAQCVT